MKLEEKSITASVRSISLKIVLKNIVHVRMNTINGETIPIICIFCEKCLIKQQGRFCGPCCRVGGRLVENWNKILRQSLPKRTNLDLISEEKIHEAQDGTVERPIKVLGGRLSLERFCFSF